MGAECKTVGWAGSAHVDKPWKEEAAEGIYGVYGESNFAPLNCPSS